MQRLRRRLISLSVGALAAGWVLAGPMSARGDDVFNGLSPVDPSTLGSTVSHNVIVGNTALTQGKVSDTRITVGNGQLTNGPIMNNQVSNNQGLTSVMMNTGNNVNFNNSFIVNVITH